MFLERLHAGRRRSHRRPWTSTRRLLRRGSRRPRAAAATATTAALARARRERACVDARPATALLHAGQIDERLLQLRVLGMDGPHDIQPRVEVAADGAFERLREIRRLYGALSSAHRSRRARSTDRDVVAERQHRRRQMDIEGGERAVLAAPGVVVLSLCVSQLRTFRDQRGGVVVGRIQRVTPRGVERRDRGRRPLVRLPSRPPRLARRRARCRTRGRRPHIARHGARRRPRPARSSPPRRRHQRPAFRTRGRG